MVGWGVPAAAGQSVGRGGVWSAGDPRRDDAPAAGRVRAGRRGRQGVLTKRQADGGGGNTRRRDAHDQATQSATVTAERPPPPPPSTRPMGRARFGPKGYVNKKKRTTQEGGERNGGTRERSGGGEGGKGRGGGTFGGGGTKRRIRGPTARTATDSRLCRRRRHTQRAPSPRPQSARPRPLTRQGPRYTHGSPGAGFRGGGGGGGRRGWVPARTPIGSDALYPDERVSQTKGRPMNGGETVEDGSQNRASGARSCQTTLQIGSLGGGLRRSLVFS